MRNEDTLGSLNVKHNGVLHMNFRTDVVFQPELQNALDAAWRSVVSVAMAAGDGTGAAGSQA